MHLIYTCNDNECIVGKNITEDVSQKDPAYKAIKDMNFKGVIVIPEFFKGKPIKHIGRCAFSRCNGITDVAIKARIISIGNYGFGDMASLKSINIPSTVETIGHHAIYPFNISSSTRANGLIVVSFEPGSKIRSINSSNFGRIERVVILINETVNPIFGSSMFFNTTSYEIFSTESFVFYNKQTNVTDNIDFYHDMNHVLHIYENQQRQKTCNCISSNKSFTSLYLIIAILSYK